MSVNKVILVGNIGKEPEHRRINNDRSVTNFTIATTEKYKDRDGNVQESTEWHNITVWGKLAEIVRDYYHKGQQVYLEGKIHTRSWEDPDGTKHYATDIIADTLQMLGGRKEENKDQQRPAPRQEAPRRPKAASLEPQNDDLPF